MRAARKPVFVAQNDEEGYGSLLFRVADACPDILIVKIKTDLRLSFVAELFQESSFGSFKRNGIAIDVDLLRISPREDLGTVRI